MSQKYPDLNDSVFPEGVDSFQQWLNITATDGPLLKKYTDAMNEGNLGLANEVLAQIPAGTQKIIKANDLNKLTQAMLAVERFYGTDVQPYVEQKQKEWEDKIDQFSYVGDWSVSDSYQVNNIVSYTQFGLTFLYIAITTPPVGALPTNKRYWRQFTVQGEQGASKDLSYRYEWSPALEYVTDDAVTYEGRIWMALITNRNVQPGTDPSAWNKVESIENTHYPIQPTPPSTLGNGDMWFNTTGNPTNYYQLEKLNNPATPQTIMLGKEAYNDVGEKMVGEFETYTKQEIDTEKAAIIKSYEVDAGQTIAQGQVVDIVNDKITAVGTPSTAIALQAGTAGQTIAVVYTGLVVAPWVAKNQVITGTNGGVFGFGILDGVLKVNSKQETENFEMKTLAGSYTGTGSYGVGNPNSLTAPFPIKLVIIEEQAKSPPFLMGGVLFANESSYIVTTNDSSRIKVLAGTLSVTDDKKTISWYADSSGTAAVQYNQSGNKYYYLIIG